MKVHTTRIHIHTYDGISMQDVAPELRDYIYRSGVEFGLCVVATSHADCALTLCDDVDERYADLIQAARQITTAGPESGSGHHDRVDEALLGAALAAFAASSLTLPIRAGMLATGSWESVLLLESRGPAERQLDVTILGN